MPDEKEIKTRQLFSEPAPGSPEEDEQEGPSLAGVTLDARYVLEERIGSGGLGEIYRARHLRMERHFAVKLLQPGMKTRPDFIGRFDREARALSKLSHPCCVAVTDYGVSDQHGPFIVMELVEGEPLSKYTRGDGLPLRSAIDLTIAALSGLEHAHGQGIIHRDIKPDNIMVIEGPLEPGRLLPKILDFGLAKMRAGFGSGPDGQQLTQAGFILGTPHYIAPERVTNPSAADDPAADIYAMGVVLYELCCGRRPFVGKDMVQVLDQHLTQAPPPPRSFRPSLPPALEAAILRALAKKPEERFASAAAFRQALEQILPLPAAIAEQRPRDAAVTSPHTRIERPVRRPATGIRPGLRRPGLIIVGLAAALLVAVLLIVLVVGGGDGPGAGAGSGSGTAVRKSKTSSKRRAATSRKPEIKTPPPKQVAATRQPETQPSTAPVPVAVPSTDTDDVDTAPAATVPPALRSIARLWAYPRSRSAAAQKFQRYLARHRGDAAAHIYVGRLYLWQLWADDGVKLITRGLKTDPRIRLDTDTLMALTFAYRGGSAMWQARKLIEAHAGPDASKILLASAVVVDDKSVERNLIADARRRGISDPLGQKLLQLAQAKKCEQQRGILRELPEPGSPVIRVMLALLRRDRCLGGEARRLIAEKR